MAGLMASAPSPSIMVLGFLCKRKPFTYNHQGLKCCGVVPRGLYETKCRMEVSGTPTTPHRPSYAPKPGGPALISPSGLVWPLGSLGHPYPLSASATLSSHPLGTHSQSLPGGVFPSPAEGPPWPASWGPPISCAAPTPPPLARGGKFLSRWAAPSSSPAGQESPKRVRR